MSVIGFFFFFLLALLRYISGLEKLLVAMGEVFLLGYLLWPPRLVR